VSASKQLTAAVVICAYTLDRWPLLERGVEAVLGQSRPPERIIVVVDHNDELLEKVGDRFGDCVVRLANVELPGLSGARNTGVAAAAEDIIAFLDDDALPSPDWLERLVDPYRDEGVLGVGGAIEPEWESRRPGWFPSEFDWVVGCTYLGMPKEAASVRNMIGANMSLRRRVFSQVGAFTHDLGHQGSVPFGCEETELCIRALQANPSGEIRYEPAAQVCHWVSDERSRFSYFRRRCYGEGGGKALMTTLVGTDDGLASERTYTARVLPAGILRGLLASSRERSLDGLLRAGAIVVGLLVVGTGYLVGRIRPARTRLPFAES
jgi:O-antigen biosynthesis protein